MLESVGKKRAERDTRKAGQGFVFPLSEVIGRVYYVGENFVNPLKCFKCGSGLIGNNFLRCRNAICSMSDWAIEEDTLRSYWCFEEINRYRRICSDHYKEILELREKIKKGDTK